MIKLNKRNEKLLKILDLDARQSNIKIAKKLRISKNVVNYNIKKLEDEGIIKGYNTLVDPAKLGLLSFRIFIDLYEKYPGADDKVVDYLQKMSGVGLLAKVIGSWDLVVGFHVPDHKTFYLKWMEFLKTFRKYIKSYQIDLLVEEILFRRSYLLNEKKDLSEHNWILGAGTEEKLDDLDKSILKELVKNARMPIKDIALKTKMTSMAIIYRINQLIKKKVIVGFRASVDYSKLGFNYYKINLELEDVKPVNQLISYCQQHPNIVKVMKSVGDFDFEFVVEIDSLENFNKLIEEMKADFPGTIRDYKYYQLVEYYKRNYVFVD